MLVTPWGDADTLRERQLPPGRSGDRVAFAPMLTYMALAPSLGAEEACEVANGRGRK